MPCQSCTNKRREFRKPGNQPEFTTQEIRDSRIEQEPAIVQPFRDGKLSRRYVEANGTKYIHVSDKEVKEAMSNPDVWNGMEGRFYDE